MCSVRFTSCDHLYIPFLDIFPLCKGRVWDKVQGKGLPWKHWLPGRHSAERMRHLPYWILPVTLWGLFSPTLQMEKTHVTKQLKREARFAIRVCLGNIPLLEGCFHLLFSVILNVKWPWLLSCRGRGKESYCYLNQTTVTITIITWPELMGLGSRRREVGRGGSETDQMQNWSSKEVNEW